MIKLGVGLALLVVACGGQQEPQKSVVEAPVAPSSTPSPPTQPTAEQPPPPAPPAAAPSNPPGPPPPGTWSIAMEEKSTTCVPYDAGPPPPAFMATNDPTFIPIKIGKDGKIAGNLPVSPNPRMFAQHRQDIPLEKGNVTKATLKPDRGCGYDIKREMEVNEVFGNKIVLTIRSEYGDSKGCAKPPQPAQCKSESVMTYTLVQKLCEPKCMLAQSRQNLDGGVDGKCVCPDAGAP